MRNRWTIWGGLAVVGLVASLGMRPSQDEGKPSVTLFLSTDCPVAARATPRIEALYEKFGQQVEFKALFPNELESNAKIKNYVDERGYEFPWAKDIAGETARSAGIEIIPTVIVRDGSGREVYRGPIDDAKSSDLVKNEYLHDALSAVVNGKTPEVKTVEPFGCYLMAGEPIPTMAEVNYSEHVAAIINDNCLACHRPNEVAPFSLEGYQNARKWSRMIALVTKERRMPPWLAVEGVGDFKHEMRLSLEEIETLQRWAEAGAPEGDKSLTPDAPEFPVGWILGEPDKVLQMPKPFKISAEGGDEYWNFVIDPGVTEPTYVQAMDVKPGNKSVVHHVIAFIDEKGASEKLLADGRDGGYLTFGGPGFIPDNSLGGWAPGLMASRYPEGSGFLLKPGAKIVLQVHYHKTGKEEVDQTRVGLYFNKGEVTQPIQIAWLANPLIRIPAGDSAKTFTQNIPIPIDVNLYSLMPHMHLLGRKMKATLVKPDGTEEGLIQVDDWDFNWQLNYMLKEPMLIKAGSRIRIEAEYDNSADNPNNPNNPPKQVTWGEETTDEMMLLVAAISPARSRN